MHRRTFTTALLASAMISWSGSTALRLTAAKTIPLSVTTTWNAARGSGSEIDRFMTTITNHGSEEIASDAFDGLLNAVQQGKIYNEETQSETIGDDSFYVRYNDPNFVIDEFVVRFGSLIYQFRAEAIHYGGARNAFRLMEEVIGRVDPTATTEVALMALLPTAEEVAVYGLTEQVKTGATPAA